MFQKIKEAFSSEATKKEDEAANITRACAEKVHRFSSQYGSETSRGYTAQNLAGDARRYPSYGDFTEAFVTRTYGKWWNIIPSTPVKIGFEEPWFEATDFVDLYYPYAVFPSKIEIYETYNPGAIVRILACNKAPHESYIDANQIRWEVLWKGSPVKAEHKAKIFSPAINDLSFPTRLIRLEFNQVLCNYYTELDAVYVTGTRVDTDTELEKAVENSIAYLDIEKLSLQDPKDGCNQKLSKLNCQTSIDERECCGLFQILPDEIISVILSLLAFEEMAKMASTCKFFKSLVYDPLWYKELNLKPYWPKINNNVLQSLLTRCIGIEKLDMQWTGPLGSVTTECFIRFIEECGSSLSHLRLAVCDFVNLQALRVISKTCKNVTELNLSSCQLGAIAPFDISCLKNLCELRTLNLYRVPVHESVLIDIFRSCNHLEFLNLGSNIAIEDGNLMLSELAKNCRNLRGLDLWRTRNMDGQGIYSLSESCKDLEELDLGWCSNIKSQRDSLVRLAKSCTKLKKLFLTAVRSVNNKDIEALANNCPLLEQLDILGTGYVDPYAIEKLFGKCKELKLLDVSFCSRISEAHIIENWQLSHPLIAIKKSFTC